MIKIFFSFFILFSSSANALVGIDSLTVKLFEKSPELSSLKQQMESKEALYSSNRSGFYPSFSAVGGWAENKTDDLATIQKGYVGYIEGRYNLFNGFKDQSLLNQGENEYKLMKIEVESKQRELKTVLTEITGDMILLHQFRKILEEEYEVNQLQMRMAARKVSAGLTGSVDNLEFKLRESELQIEKNQIEQLHKDAHLKLIKLFGEDVTDTDLSAIEFSAIDNLSFQNKKLTLENTLEYQKAQLNLSKAEYEKSQSRSDFLPKLDLILNVGRLTPSENTPARFNESKYGITLTIPLFSGFDTYYKIKASNFQVSSAEKRKIQKEKDLTVEFNVLKNRASELIQLYTINESKLTNSNTYFNMTLSEYKRGVKNSPDLVGATERLFSAKKKKYEILKELELLNVKIENLL